MSGCFNVGLEFGSGINFGSLTPDIYKTLPATLLVTLGGFVTNAVYCFYQNHKNRTWATMPTEPSSATTCSSASLPELSGTASSSDSHSAKDS